MAGSRELADDAALTGSPIAACDRPSGGAVLRTSVLYDEALGSALFGGVVTAFLLFVLSQIVPEELRYAFEAVDAQGHVTGLQVAGVGPRAPVVAAIPAHGGGRRPRHLVDYEYTDAAGVAHAGRCAVPADVWRGLAIGGPVNVRYLRDAPDQSRVEGAVHTPPLLLVGMSAACVLAAGLSVKALCTGIGTVRRNVELFQSGEPVLGRIVDVQVVKGRKGRITRTLHYCYAAPDALSGQVMAFTGTFRGSGRRGKTADRGDSLLVCYDARDPQRHAVDRYGLFGRMTPG